MTKTAEIQKLQEEWYSLSCQLRYCETDWVNCYERSIQIRRRMDEIDARLYELTNDPRYQNKEA